MEEKEVEGTKVRLVRIALWDRGLREYSPGQRSADIGPLREVAPEGCGLRTKRITYAGIQHYYSLWTIVVAVPTGLSEEGWSEVRKQMQGVLEMKSLLGWMPVLRHEEGPTLEVWEKELSGGERSGSWREVRAALRLPADAGGTELAAQAGRCLQLDEEEARDSDK
jgi:hypothetical protein